MSTDQFLAFTGPLPEPMLLLTASGRIRAGNPAVGSRLGIAIEDLIDRTLAEVVQQPAEAVADYLRICARNRQLVLGALDLEVGGVGIPCRAEGALLRPANEGDDALLVLRLQPRNVTTERFVALEQRIRELDREIARRRRTELALREREERLAVTLSSIGDGVIVTDPQGRIESINFIAAEMAGWHGPDAIGRPLSDVFRIVDELNGNPVENPVEKVLRTGRVEGLANHTVLVARDGTARPIDDSAAPICGRDGEMLGVVLVVRDVTEKRAFEAELHRRLHDLQALFDTAPIAIWVARDPGCADIVANRHAAELLSAGDVAERPEELAAIRSCLQQVIADGVERRNQELELGPPGAAALHVIGNSAPLLDHQGGIRGAIATFVDISEQKRARKALEDSERIYRAIGESIDYGVWIADEEGRNVYASESFLKLVGLTQQECSDLGWTGSLEAEEARRTREAWQECVRTLTPWDWEHRFLGSDGRYHAILARGVPVRNADGRVVCWAGINLDISRMKEVQLELREADRRKDDFLATLAHELRGPLAPIRNAMHIVRLSADRSDIREDAIAVMDRQIDQMVRLIDDLMDVSRISRDKLRLRLAQLNLHEVIARAIELVDALPERRERSLVVELPDEPLPVHGDHVRLTQVFWNLLHNACKFTRAGGRIRLSAARRAGEVVVAVADDGIGIEPEQRARLFQMFAQVAPALDRPHGGLGIGLSLVRRLTELHGGRVEAESEGAGCGSEFRVWLPLASAGDAAAAGDAPPQAPRRVGRRRILVTDDNRDNAESLAALLTIMGHEVATAGDGVEALEVAERFRPTVVLMDIGMPQMNGYDVARRLRATDWGRQVFLVAVTGWGQESDRRRAIAAGFDRHLTKPVQARTLEELLGDAR